MTEKYQKPVGVRILREGHAQLYRLEGRAVTSINEAAKALGQCLGHTEDQFHTHTLPEALYTILDSFDPVAAMLACDLFLKKNETYREDYEKKIADSTVI